jgi:hypothetical protein
MKISELPQEIKELALENIKYQKTEIINDCICRSFNWLNSKEGLEFWYDWYHKEYEPDLKLENRIISLELKIEELINNLKTN